MESEEVEFWTYRSDGQGNIVIHFEKNKKHIKISSKDVKSMMSWVMMDQGTYIPNRYDGFKSK